MEVYLDLFWFLAAFCWNNNNKKEYHVWFLAHFSRNNKKGKRHELYW